MGLTHRQFMAVELIKTGILEGFLHFQAHEQRILKTLHRMQVLLI